MKKLGFVVFLKLAKLFNRQKTVEYLQSNATVISLKTPVDVSAEDLVTLTLSK